VKLTLGLTQPYNIVGNVCTHSYIMN